MSHPILEDLSPDLEALDFVDWDRFTVGDWDGQPYVTVYGWIEREDEYKDFVVLLRWQDGNTYYTTSSAERTQDIYRVLWPGDSVEDHNDCQRVEDHIDIQNAVRLVADGGEVECGYCGTEELVYELRSDRGPVGRCIPCLALEQGQQSLSLPFEAFTDFDPGPVYDSREQVIESRERSYDHARDWYRILARWRMDEPLLKRDPEDFGTVAGGIRSFLTNVMGASAHYAPSEIIEAGGSLTPLVEGGDSQ